VEAQISEFLDALAHDKGYARNTVEAYRNDLEQLVHFAQRERPTATLWDRVDKPLLLTFILHLKERGYTAASIARKIAVWKTFFRFLTARRMIVADPTATLGSPRVDKRAPQILSADEIARLMAAPAANHTPKGLRDGAILELLCASGVRVSELAMLDVDDVDLPAQILRVGRAAKQRTLPLPARTIEVLTQYLARGRLELARADTRALFVNPHGARLTRQGLWLIIKEYVQAAGLTTPVTPHTLRHSFAARMLSEGAELSAVQRLLGHANLSTTQKYARLPVAQADGAEGRV
jgi:integrase/recombinase XerD